jgi:lysophospholipase L1-like esterase
MINRRFASALSLLLFAFATSSLLAQSAAPPTIAPPPIVSASRPTAPLRFEAADQPHQKVGANGNPDAGFIRLHNQYVAQAKAGNIDLYMLGDSITDFWLHTHKANWDKNFGGWKVGDFGISGDRTQHVLWRLDNGELDGVTPKVIVLLIGTNNLPANTVYQANTEEDTFKGYKAIVDKLKEKEPQAHILLMGVFPREDPRYSAEILKTLSAEIKILNDQIATLADGTQIKYLNINDKYTDKDGKLIPGVMQPRDRLHPTDQGYDIWADAMRPILTEWLGPQTK